MNAITFKNGIKNNVASYQTIWHLMFSQQCWRSVPSRIRRRVDSAYWRVWGDYSEDLDYAEAGDRKINRSVDKYLSFFYICVHTVHLKCVLFICVNKHAFVGTDK